MNKIEIDDFDNRGDEKFLFGYIVFTDGTRIGYAPGTRGSDEDGLFDAQQPYLTQQEGMEPGSKHWTLARTWAREVNSKIKETEQV